MIGRMAGDVTGGVAGGVTGGVTGGLTASVPRAGLKASVPRADMTAWSRYEFYGVSVGVASNRAAVVDGMDTIYGLFKRAGEAQRGQAADAACDLQLNVTVHGDDMSDLAAFDIEAKARKRSDCGNFLIEKEVRGEREEDGYRVFDVALTKDCMDWLCHLECSVFYFALRNLERFLPLHAACVARGGRAIVLPGRSGAGKTTLAYLLAKSGFQFLSDELALIDRDDLMVYPFPRSAMMRSDVAHLASAEDFRGDETLCVGGREKHFVSVRPGEIQSFDRPLEVGSVIFPEYRRRGEAKLERVGKTDAMAWLFEINSLRTLSGEPERQARAVATALTVIERADTYRLIWNDGSEAGRLIEEACF